MTKTTFKLSGNAYRYNTANNTVTIAIPGCGICVVPVEDTDLTAGQLYKLKYNANSEV